MANFYTDNPNIKFYLTHPLIKHIVELKERNFADKDKYDYAPENFEDAMDNYERVLELAGDVMANVVAPNAEAVDAGWIDHDRQIGQTGVTVRPKVYIACGISGQIQHIAGMQDAGIIISVNSDPDAPINTIADYVINGTVEEVVPKLIKYYKENNK